MQTKTREKKEATRKDGTTILAAVTFGGRKAPAQKIQYKRPTDAPKVFSARRGPLKKGQDEVFLHLSTQTRVSNSEGVVLSFAPTKNNMKSLPRMEIKVNRHLSFEVVPLHQLKAQCQNVSISVAARSFTGFPSHFFLLSRLLLCDTVFKKDHVTIALDFLCTLIIFAPALMRKDTGPLNNRKPTA